MDLNNIINFILNLFNITNTEINYTNDFVYSYFCGIFGEMMSCNSSASLYSLIITINTFSLLLATTYLLYSQHKAILIIALRGEAMPNEKVSWYIIRIIPAIALIAPIKGYALIQVIVLGLGIAASNVANVAYESLMKSNDFIKAPTEEIYQNDFREDVAKIATTALCMKYNAIQSKNEDSIKPKVNIQDEKLYFWANANRTCAVLTFDKDISNEKYQQRVYDIHKNIIAKIYSNIYNSDIIVEDTYKIDNTTMYLANNNKTEYDEYDKKIIKILDEQSIFYKNEISKEINNISNELLENFKNKSIIFNNGYKWYMAGFYDREILKTRSIINSIKKLKPTYDITPSSSIAEDGAFFGVMKDITKTLNQYLENVSSFDAFTALTVKVFTGIDYKNLKSEGRNTLVLLYDLGITFLDNIVYVTTFLGAAFTAALGVGGGIGVITGGGITGTATIASTGALGAILVVMPLFLLILSVLATAGAFYAFVIPNVFLFLFLGMVITFLITFSTLVIASPLWIVNHLRPDGDGFFGSAKSGYIHLVSLFLTPLFLVIAYAITTISLDIVMNFINSIYFDFIDLSLNDKTSIMTSLLNILLHMSLMTYVSIQIVKLSILVLDYISLILFGTSHIFKQSEAINGNTTALAMTASALSNASNAVANNATSAISKSIDSKSSSQLKSNANNNNANEFKQVEELNTNSNGNSNKQDENSYNSLKKKSLDKN